MATQNPGSDKEQQPENHKGNLGICNLQKLESDFNLAYANDENHNINQLGNELSKRYFQLNDYKKSHHFGIQVYLKLGESTDVEILTRLALIFSLFKKLEESLFFYRKAQKIYAQSDDKRKEMNIWHNMAMLSFNQKDFENYFEYELNAYKLALSTKNTKKIYLLGHSLGGFLIRTGKQKDGALRMLKTSYQIGLKAGYQDVGKIEMFLRQMGELT